MTLSPNVLCSWFCITGLLACAATSTQGSFSDLRADGHRRSLQRTASFIVNGQNVSSGYDFVGLVQYNATLRTSGAATCTGSLIAPNKILTAGHCCAVNGTLYNISGGRMRALVGAYQLTNSKGKFGDLSTEKTAGAVLRTAVNISVPKQYLWGFRQYDVCVMTLNETITTITPAALVAANSTLPVGSQATAIGWGIQADDANANSVVSELASANRTTFPCPASAAGSFPSKAPYSICYSSADAIGACSGDSGGPLLVDKVVQASDAFGSGRDSGYCSSNTSFNIYINMAAPEISTFIKNSVENTPAAGTPVSPPSNPALRNGDPTTVSTVTGSNTTALSSSPATAPIASSTAGSVALRPKVTSPSTISSSSLAGK